MGRWADCTFPSRCPPRSSRDIAWYGRMAWRAASRGLRGATMCCARAVSAASSGHTHRRRWPPAISSWSRAPAAGGTARPTQYNRPQEMNPTAIYSKSGKGVQEAAGKTSLLTRPDRAVLSAIDGRATLADVAQKVGKTFDNAFATLVATLDKNGFIRAVSAGAGAAPAAPAAAAAPK